VSWRVLGVCWSVESPVCWECLEGVGVIGVC